MTVFGITDRGAVRENNQDSLRIHLAEESERCIAVLCDGMGGARGGQTASETAAEAFLAHAKEALEASAGPELATVGRESAAYANLKVYDLAQRTEPLRGMGTTLVSAIVERKEAVVINIGDSRCYWVADGQIRQVTRDHSLVQQMIEQGILTEEEAGSHPRKNVITRAVGTERTVRSDVFRIDLQAGDILLLCSDGLSNVVSEEELLSVLLENTELSDSAGRLLETAMSRGAPDNVTVILLRR